MLYNYVVNAYKKLFKGKKVPLALYFRLNNIGARNINYDEFINYFDIKNEFEALEFILDDKHMEEIMRYSLRQLEDGEVSYYSHQKNKRGYNKDSNDEHQTIDKYLQKEEKEYRKK